MFDGTVLVYWTGTGTDKPVEGAIVQVGEGRTLLASGEVESFCFTTAEGSVFVAVRSPEPTIADAYEVRRVPLLSRARDANLLVDDGTVQIVIITMRPDEANLVYEVVCADTETLRLEFNPRDEKYTDIPPSQGGKATLIRSPNRPNPPKVAATPDPAAASEVEVVELEVTVSGDYFKPSNRRVEPAKQERQWPAVLRLPPTEERIRMPAIAEILDRFLREQEHDTASVVQRLIEQAKTTQHSLFVIGGAVRDALVGTKLDPARTDLDLAGDIPPSMFCYWVRQIGADLNLNLTTSTSSTNVTRIYLSDGPPVRLVAEYALFKYARGGSGWTGCNDVYSDYKTRDLAENTLMYDPSTGEILTASDELFHWLNADGAIDPKKYASKLTVISDRQGSRLHASLGTWAYVNVLARLMKSYVRLVREGQTRPSPEETAKSLNNLLPAIQGDVDMVCEQIGVEASHVLAAAMVEACPESVQRRRVAAKWLGTTLYLAAGQRDLKILREWEAANDLACGDDPRWVNPKDLNGHGLARAVKDRGGRWVVDPLGVEMETGLTPALVSRKLGAIVAAWNEVRLGGITRGDDVVTARAFQNPESTDRYLVVVDAAGLPVVAEPLPEQPPVQNGE
jgi:hypothetical protein